MLTLKTFSAKEVVLVDKDTGTEYVLKCKDGTDEFRLDVLEEILGHSLTLIELDKAFEKE